MEMDTPHQPLSAQPREQNARAAAMFMYYMACSISCSMLRVKDELALWALLHRDVLVAV